MICTHLEENQLALWLPLRKNWANSNKFAYDTHPVPVIWWFCDTQRYNIKQYVHMEVCQVSENTQGGETDYLEGGTKETPLTRCFWVKLVLH